MRMADFVSVYLQVHQKVDKRETLAEGKQGMVKTVSGGSSYFQLCASN